MNKLFQNFDNNQKNGQEFLETLLYISESKIYNILAESTNLERLGKMVADDNIDLPIKINIVKNMKFYKNLI